MPLAELRQRCVGTGPFKLKEYVRGQTIELERNPDYFVPNRPYLDGIRYTIITERGTRLAALQAGRLDAFVPLEMTKVMAEHREEGGAELVVQETGQNGSDNVVAEPQARAVRQRDGAAGRQPRARPRTPPSRACVTAAPWRARR